MYKNFDLWNLYNRDIVSPQNFIDFGWYFLVSAALGRKVWKGPDHQKLYPNHYTILVGDPGVGKGLIIKQILEFLREHKLNDATVPKQSGGITDKKLVEKVIQSANFASAPTRGPKPAEDKLLIPIAANCVTFEALTRACASNTRAIFYSRFDKVLNKKVDDIARYAALAFCLEELSSLFRCYSQQ